MAKSVQSAIFLVAVYVLGWAALLSLYILDIDAHTFETLQYGLTYFGYTISLISLGLICSMAKQHKVKLKCTCRT